MPSTFSPTGTDIAVKISIRLDGPLWTAWSKLSANEGFDPIDYMRMLMRDAVTKADPPVLPESELVRQQRLDRMIRKVVETARAMFPAGFSADFTSDVLRQVMRDEAFVADYTAHIGGKDPYLHGNPLKEVNVELCWRIKNANVGVEVLKDPNGKTVLRRNVKGEIVQSYTLLKLVDPEPEPPALAPTVLPPEARGGILAALRRSPLVGADLDLARPRVPVREVDL